MSPPTHDEIAALAAVIAKAILASGKQFTGCQAMAFRVAISALGTIEHVRITSTAAVHPEALDSWKDVVAKTVARLPKPPPHRCPDCPATVTKCPKCGTLYDQGDARLIAKPCPNCTAAWDHGDDERRGSRGK